MQSARSHAQLLSRAASTLVWTRASVYPSFFPNTYFVQYNDLQLAFHLTRAVNAFQGLLTVGGRPSTLNEHSFKFVSSTIIFTYRRKSFVRLANTLSGKNSIAFEVKYLWKDKPLKLNI